MRYVSTRGLGLAAVFLLSTSGFALATPSGTSIVNTIDLSYETGGNAVTVDDAATVTFVVDTAIDLLVEGMDASNSVSATQGDDPAVLTFRVENLSNDAIGFDIDVASAGTLGLTYDAAGTGGLGTYFVAYDTVATYDPATATIYDTAGLLNVMDRATDEDFYIFVVGKVPTNAADGAVDTFTVTATALTQSTNTAVVEVTGQGPSAVDIVFADPDEDGIEEDAETLVIEAPNLSATKTQAVISENRDGTFDCATGTAVVGAEAFIPGACVEYTITVTNATGASVDADNLVITDVLPSNVTYVTDDEGTFDSVAAVGSTVTGSLSVLAPGDSASFTVRVTIDN